MTQRILLPILQGGICSTILSWTSGRNSTIFQQDTDHHRHSWICFRLKISCSISKRERLSCDWVRKSRPNFRLFHPCKIRGDSRNAWVNFPFL